jgi:uncharacterized coiled-coil protein SlyX
MTESLEERMARLERVLVLQHTIIDRLTTAVTGHQMTITAFAELLGIELQPAQPPTSSN